MIKQSQHGLRCPSSCLCLVSCQFPCLQRSKHLPLTLRSVRLLPPVSQRGWTMEANRYLASEAGGVLNKRYASCNMASLVPAISDFRDERRELWIFLCYQKLFGFVFAKSPPPDTGTKCLGRGGRALQRRITLQGEPVAPGLPLADQKSSLKRTKYPFYITTMETSTSSHAGRLNNKVPIVTGSLSGISHAITRTYIHEGAKVVYADITPRTRYKIDHDITATALEILKQEGGKNRSITVKADESIGKDVQAFVKKTVNHFTCRSRHIWYFRVPLRRLRDAMPDVSSSPSPALFPILFLSHNHNHSFIHSFIQPSYPPISCMHLL